MNSTTMPSQAPMNEEVNRQQSNETTVTSSEKATTGHDAGKRNFTAAQMWYMQRNVRSADRIHRRIPR